MNKYKLAWELAIPRHNAHRNSLEKMKMAFSGRSVELVPFGGHPILGPVAAMGMLASAGWLNETVNAQRESYSKELAEAEQLDVQSTGARYGGVFEAKSA